MSDSPLITQEELDILVASMAIAEQQAPPGRDAHVALYDFRDTSKLSPDQAHELEDRCAVLSKVLTRTLTAYLNAPVTVSFEGLDHPSFDQYIKGLPPNPVLAIFPLDPHAASAVWQIDVSCAVPLLSAMLGSVTATPPPPTHELTPIESALLRRLIDEMLHTWTLTWPALATYQPHVERITTTVATLDITSDSQEICHAAFRFRIGDISGPSNLALPQAAIQRILRTDADTRSPASQRIDTSLATPLSQQAVRSVLPITVEVARTRMTLRELGNLQPGDVIPLNKHAASPLTLCVAGTPKFYAEPGHYMAHSAARVIKPIPTP